MTTWEKRPIVTDFGAEVEAILPVIVSASRSTDIPGCYADWFMHRFLKRGYLVWKNPFNRKPTYVSFERTRAIVFWTKNPAPMMKHLDELDERGVNYYFHCTLNDYEEEGLEPNIPPLERRIEDLIALSDRIGRRRVIWRFDPIVIANGLEVGDVLERVRTVGKRVHPHTERLVFSFVDLAAYRKLSSSVGEGLREPSGTEMEMIAAGIAEMNRDWGLDLSTCGESRSFIGHGIRKGSCVDGDLLMSLFPGDRELVAHIRKNNRKDRGQRESCNCIGSKDIGEYNTCPHLCRYCYANCSRRAVAGNVAKHDLDRYGETISGA